MTDPASAPGPRPSPTVGAGAVCVVVLAVAGLVFGRPDAVALAVPLALCVLGALLHRGGPAPRVTVSAEFGPAADRPGARIAVGSSSEMVQLSLTQGHRHTTSLVVAGDGQARATSRLLHSGPTRLVSVVARGLTRDGALRSPVTSPAHLDWQAMPEARPLPVLPLAPRLVGLHGGHEGARPGHGGDFRDIHPFTPGDELRRVDWRATARAARRPGELMVRRTNTLSDASVVILLDNVEELGESVASWGTGDPERSGVTSLDLAREAARSLAEATVSDGDRVAYHEMTPGGRSVRSGAGRRHLARVTAAIAATGRGHGDTMIRRAPPIPTGSVVYVLSTFLDDSASRLALAWRATGHRVVAVDVLPAPDRERLTAQQSLSLRIVLAERALSFEDLRGAGIDIVAWGTAGDAAAVDLRLAARIRR